MVLNIAQDSWLVKPGSYFAAQIEQRCFAFWVLAFDISNTVERKMIDGQFRCSLNSLSTGAKWSCWAVYRPVVVELSIWSVDIFSEVIAS
ncbi:hypothetical protein O9929_28320 [Vibrio lentus]|nr:hypothetical protein [Vibrio lentus]